MNIHVPILNKDTHCQNIVSLRHLNFLFEWTSKRTIGIVFIQRESSSSGKKYLPWGTPTDSQERFYFPCYKSQNYTKIMERISKHFVFVSENFSDIGQEITPVYF